MDSEGGDVMTIMIVIVIIMTTTMVMVVMRALGVRIRLLTEILIVLICELSAKETFN
jgi:hypothetical protein